MTKWKYVSELHGYNFKIIIYAKDEFLDNVLRINVITN